MTTNKQAWQWKWLETEEAESKSPQPGAPASLVKRRGAADGAAPLFDGIFLSGFECSCHVLEDGRRLDLVESTHHQEFAALDYSRLKSVGIHASREGVSWVRAARGGGDYDFSGVMSRLRAAERHSVQVIWDLMHFGWPSEVDPFSPKFPGQFAEYAAAFARWYSTETDQPAMLAPINEISFLSWAGGDVRVMNPFELARGVELKVQLVRATIEGIEAIRSVLPRARFLQPEPLINIVPNPDHPKTWRRVEGDNLLQYQAWDMLTGKVWPSLGGAPHYLDIIGVNYYSDNQFMLDGTTISPHDPRYRPFSEMLSEAYRRYRRPMIISETGAEGKMRAPWFRYVCEQARVAMDQGCELHGITLYPIINHPGWVDERRCENGLWDYADEAGNRALYLPLAEEMQRQEAALLLARARALARASAASNSP